MHSLFQLINSLKSVPEPKDINSLRGQILDRLLRILVLFCSVVLVISLISTLQKGLWLPALIFFLMYVWLVTIAFISRIPFWLRAGSLLVIELTCGVVGLISSGLSGDGRNFLFAFLVTTVILMGTRFGITALVLSMIIFLVTGLGMSSGWIPLPPEAVLLNSGNRVDWITGTLTFFLLGFACISMISFILNGLAKNIERQKLLTLQLKQEQQTLEERVHQRTQELEQEIIERKAAEENLSEARSLLETSFEQSPAGVMIADAPNITLRYHNAAATEILGIDPKEDVINLPLTRITTSWKMFNEAGKEYSLEQRPIFRTVIKGEVIHNERERVIRADGSQRWILLNGSPLRNEYGEVIAGVVIFTDITLAHEAGQALEQSEERYRRLVELSPDAIAIHQNGRLEFVNPAAIRLMGAQTEAELIGRPIQMVVAQEYQKIVADRVREAMATGQPLPLMEEKFVRMDGSLVPVEVASSPCVLNGELAMQVFVRDISNRKETESQLRQSRQELSDAYDATLFGWARALELRERQTAVHSQRVVEMTVRLARRMGVDEEEIFHVRRGALLHDIGKMGIPDHILLKPAPLSDDEWTIMRQHPTIAEELLSPIPYLAPSLDIPRAHHEKWDGSGYPHALKGEEIPLAARIFAVVDVWDALITDRPYRPAWPEREALEYIRRQSGSHFDPAVTEVFLQEIAKG